LVLLCLPLNVRAFNIRGVVHDKTNSSSLYNCDIAVTQGDSIICTINTGNSQQFEIKDLPAGKYQLEADAWGYERFYDEIDLTDDHFELVLLTPLKVVNLEEVEVVADKSQMTVATSTGTIFYLSKEAKARRNPFMALQEIPLLISNPNDKTVTSLDGEDMLVLIDGNEVNSGIAPVNAEDIESVEVMTNPSLKYRIRGVNKVLNLRLKRKEAPYVWTEFSASGSLPSYYQNLDGAFEVGNPKMGIYGRASGSYANLRTNYSTLNITPGYSLDYSGKMWNESWNTSGNLLFKLMPSLNDYVAVKARYSYDYGKNKAYAGGVMDASDDAQKSYFREIHGRSMSEVVSGSAYYKHIFMPASTLEIIGNYDYSRNRPISTSFSGYGEVEPVAETMNYSNSRHSGNLKLSWDLADMHGNYWQAGALGRMDLAQIRYFSGNISDYDNDQYLAKTYVGWARDLFSRKVSFDLNVSLENIWLSDAMYDRHYMYLGGMAGVLFNFNQAWALNVRYYLSSIAPSVKCLNPYNTSTDPLVEFVGNPDLEPERNHFLFANVSFSSGGWFIMPGVSYNREENQVVRYGYFKPDGVYVYTYENGGSTENVSTEVTVSRRIPNGRIAIGGGPQWMFIRNQSEHLIWNAQASFNKYFDKFNFDVSLRYASRQIGEYYVADYKGLSEFKIAAYYNFTPEFYIGLRLENCAGRLNVTNIYRNGDYYTREVASSNYRDFYVSLTVSYTFRKNRQRKINMRNVLDTESKAISIER